MKKILIALLAVSFLVACSSKPSKQSYTAKVDEPNTVLVEGSKVSISRQEIYEFLMDEIGANYVLDEALKMIANEVITDEEAINKEADAILETQRNVLTSEEALNDYIISLGFESLDTYKEKVIIPTAKQNLLVTQYVSENFNALAKEYNYKKIKLITFNLESEAFEVNSKVTKGELTFDEAFEKYNKDTSQTSASLGLVSSLTSTLDSSIATILPQLTELGHYTAPIALSNGKTWAILYVEEVNVETMKDEIITNLLTQTAVKTKLEIHYFKQHKFDVFEPSIKKQIQSLPGGYLEE